nr:hypothetical protein [Nocardia miyunensis]
MADQKVLWRKNNGADSVADASAEAGDRELLQLLVLIRVGEHTRPSIAVGRIALTVPPRPVSSSASTCTL